MNYEQKYLKYKAKYLDLKAKLEGGLVGDEKNIKNTQQVIEKTKSKISVLEKAIKGRQNNILDSENRKKRTIENRKSAKNSDEIKELDEGILLWDSRISEVKKDIGIKTKELEIQKKILDKNTLKLNELLKNKK
jgi:nitrogenase subunit NifH